MKKEKKTAALSKLLARIGSLLQSGAGMKRKENRKLTRRWAEGRDRCKKATNGNEAAFRWNVSSLPPLQSPAVEIGRTS
jgi:hypothetical protein